MLTPVLQALQVLLGNLEGLESSYSRYCGLQNFHILAQRIELVSLLRYLQVLHPYLEPGR